MTSVVPASRGTSIPMSLAPESLDCQAMLKQRRPGGTRTSIAAAFLKGVTRIHALPSLRGLPPAQRVGLGNLRLTLLAQGPSGEGIRNKLEQPSRETIISRGTTGMVSRTKSKDTGSGIRATAARPRCRNQMARARRRRICARRC